MRSQLLQEIVARHDPRLRSSFGPQCRSTNDTRWLTTLLGRVLVLDTIVKGHIFRRWTVRLCGDSMRGHDFVTAAEDPDGDFAPS